MNYKKAGTILMLAGLLLFTIELFSLPIGHKKDTLLKEIYQEKQTLEDEALAELNIVLDETIADNSEYWEWQESDRGNDWLEYKVKMDHWLEYEILIILDNFAYVSSFGDVMIYFIFGGLALYIGGKENDRQK